ncbi:MAG TPA: GntR family transcriptional regulator [Rhizomicrobium sp.]|jgi:DNA-binding GntR family transcriptional regulator|nr:GntR family transcriptional regulator [Rhizomicrobium sp.]
MSQLLPADDRDLSKTERVYGVLRRRIRELTLPPGAPLRKEEIALELGVSRAPVSDAITRLAEEGLVDVFPQHGSFVAAIRSIDVREALFIRTALETEAMRQLALRADADVVRELDGNISAQAKALAAGNLEQFYDLDEALHAMIFGAIEKPRSLKLLDAARAPLDRVRRLALPEEGRPEQTLAEHRALVDAIRSADSEYAASAMRAHLSAVGRAIEKKLPEIEAAHG